MNFKKIDGHNGKYSISDCGVVINNVTGEVKKQGTDKDGYKTVSLYYGKQKNYRVHRLVATAFLDKKPETDVVNHKNKIRDDNRVTNLEWCTVEYNNQHALAKKCNLISPLGDVVAVLNYSEFARNNKLSNSKISELALGKLSHYRGWRLYNKNEAGKPFDFEKSPKAKRYVCTSPDGDVQLIENLKRFCSKNNLSNSKMVAVARGRQKQHKGWCCRYEG